ncbi:hypothetical protein [Mucilaginibacter gotjawali]|uniref:Uncharacterized protein n=1 Tax=Mucilaginibacter gotjawali TaxID=1550579 RepID=A0A839SC30_9SPHI|nr:hypothetical protein [Mucilaginibacter gotjawali]MBB3054862.1 hypothetical protein [Mucilaginibacter gotjawali]
MKARKLPALLFAVLIMATGCKKNNVKTVPPTPPCNGPQLLKENILPDYLIVDGGLITVYDEIAADLPGNVYIENTSQEFTDPNLTNGIAGIAQGYLYKFDALGNQVYTKPAITGYQSAIAVDSMQQVYIGYFTILDSPWHSIVNATKYNSSGDTAWSKHIYYAMDATFTSLGVSNIGILHVAADDISAPLDNQYNDPTVQVQPGSGNMMYTFDQTGKLTHVKQISTGFSTASYQFLPSGGFYDIYYAAGYTAIADEYDLNSKLVNTRQIAVPERSTVFCDSKTNIYNIDSTTITKYTGGNTKAWSIKVPPFKLVKTGADGNLYIAGTFNGSVNFNPAGTSKTLTAHGNNDSFLAKIDADGKMTWVIQSLGTDGKTYTGASQIDKFVFTGKNGIFVTGSALNSNTHKNVHFGALYMQCE